MKTIVIIDSNSITRALLSHCLAGKGWRVLEADDGAAGLELVVKHKPAAVLCDLRTPKENGFKVCQTIREDPTLKKVLVLLTSLSRLDSDRARAIRAGADEYLVKPIAPNLLLHALKACDPDGTTVIQAPHSGLDPRGPTIVRFWGVRGSIPTPGIGTVGIGGNTACVEVRSGDQIVIIDAGSGIRSLGQSLSREFRDRPYTVNLLVSHTHWDHIQGFPFFLPAYNPRVHVRILGYEGSVHGLRGAIFEQMQNAFFPVRLQQMASNITFEELDGMQFQLGPVRIRAAFTNHPGICLGYRFSTAHGDVVYLSDHEAHERFESERQRQSGRASAGALALARERDEKIIDFIRGADVLIADAQYDAIEYSTRLGWGHSCVDDAVRNAIRAGVKRLFLFHHDPDHFDGKVGNMLDHGRKIAQEAGSALEIDVAREGGEVVLNLGPQIEQPKT